MFFHQRVLFAAFAAALVLYAEPPSIWHSNLHGKAISGSAQSLTASYGVSFAETKVTGGGRQSVLDLYVFYGHFLPSNSPDIEIVRNVYAFGNVAGALSPAPGGGYSVNIPDLTRVPGVYYMWVECIVDHQTNTSDCVWYDTTPPFPIPIALQARPLRNGQIEETNGTRRGEFPQSDGSRLISKSTGQTSKAAAVLTGFIAAVDAALPNADMREGWIEDNREVIRQMLRVPK